MVSGYALAFGLTLIPAGQLGDRLGRRRLFLVGRSGFTLLGGLLITAGIGGLSWQPIFLHNVPIGAVALAAAWRRRPESRGRGGSLDPAGIALVTVALLLVTYPLVEGQTAGWPTWAIAALAATTPALAVFALWQHSRTQVGRPPLVANLVLARVSVQDAGAAGGVVNAAQRVGTALGIAIVGVVLFGSLSHGALPAANAATPTFRHDLAAIGLPARARAQVVHQFDACFSMPASANAPRHPTPAPRRPAVQERRTPLRRWQAPRPEPPGPRWPTTSPTPCRHPCCSTWPPSPWPACSLPSYRAAPRRLTAVASHVWCK